MQTFIAVIRVLIEILFILSAFILSIVVLLQADGDNKTIEMAIAFILLLTTFTYMDSKKTYTIVERRTDYEG